jgi:hypothetical protein
LPTSESWAPIFHHIKERKHSKAQPWICYISSCTPTKFKKFKKREKKKKKEKKRKEKRKKDERTLQLKPWHEMIRLKPHREYNYPEINYWACHSLLRLQLGKSSGQ